MSARHGASDSATALKKSLEKIGYTVKLKENLTSTQMKEKLEKVRKEIVPCMMTVLFVSSQRMEMKTVYTELMEYLVQEDLMETTINQCP